MAKKAKRASKRPETHLVENFKKLEVSSQAVLLLELGKLYEKAKTTRLGLLKAEMDEITGSKKKGVKKTRVKPAAKYRSKKDKKLTWSGRGSTPRWMKEEMKALKLKPDAFLLKNPK
ncbi:H-NS family nucleoid-associated regulatory protein [Bradyrhizobium sp. UFLA01-814]|uniref:H-NS family nucleoid-associated regulatory protein n=1 Tax=Bradyrhizobium sp. UFLA01-814 TaxID=3023480 RepID=UPI00398BAD6B